MRGRWTTLTLMLVSMAVSTAAGAGVIAIPISGFPIGVYGETAIRSLSSGSLLLTSEGVSGSAVVACDSAACVAAGLDGAAVDLVQDLRVLIDLADGSLSGKARGLVLLPESNILLPDTAKFAGELSGRLLCEADSERACAVATVEARITTTLASEGDGSLLGVMELLLVGSLEPSMGVVEWSSLEGHGTVVLFEADMEVEGNDW